MSLLYKLLVSFALATLLLTSEHAHVHARRFEHLLDSEEVTLDSRGVLRDMIVLSEENGIKVSAVSPSPACVLIFIMVLKYMIFYANLTSI